MIEVVLMTILALAWYSVALEYSTPQKRLKKAKELLARKKRRSES